MFSQLVQALPAEVSGPLHALHAIAKLYDCADEGALSTVARPTGRELARLLFVIHGQLTEGLAEALMARPEA